MVYSWKFFRARRDQVVGRHLESQGWRHDGALRIVVTSLCLFVSEAFFFGPKNSLALFLLGNVSHIAHSQRLRRHRIVPSNAVAYAVVT